MNDKESQTILTEQRTLSDITGQPGWATARRKLLEYVEQLNNSDLLDDRSPEGLLIDLRAKKYARTILTSWLEELEGSNEVVANNTTPKLDSVLINLE